MTRASSSRRLQSQSSRRARRFRHAAARRRSRGSPAASTHSRPRAAADALIAKATSTRAELRALQHWLSAQRSKPTPLAVHDCPRRTCSAA